MAIPAMGQGLHGIREETPHNLWLDAGVLYYNIDVSALRGAGPGQLAAAIAAGTKLGATRGGASFNMNKKMRSMPVDGKRSDISGMMRIEMYEPTLTVHLLEVSQANIEKSMAPMDTTAYTAYDEITPSINIQPGDYFSNVSLITAISGKANPVVLVLSNCIAKENSEIKVSDNDEMVFEVKFVACASLDAPHVIPVSIFYPQDAAAS